jgi:hypothetical protein
MPESERQALQQVAAWERELADKEKKCTAADKPGVLPLGHVSAEASSRLRTWRLGGHVHTQLQALASGIESMWWELFDEHLQGDHEADERWDLLDSAHPTGSSTWDWDRHAPQKGDARYPQIVLENRRYQTNIFRSLHLELAVSQTGLQVRTLWLLFAVLADGQPSSNG